VVEYDISCVGIFPLAGAVLRSAITNVFRETRFSGDESLFPNLKRRKMRQTGVALSPARAEEISYPGCDYYFCMLLRFAQSTRVTDRRTLM
jgi:hypothetical protein